MPPVPPTELGGQTMPLERGQPPLQAQSHMPQQRPGGESLEGPTPPPFTDMSGVINQGQAYADTQRIIAAKRKSDAERARNRSDIADGQAYVDTQKLLESGPPLELRQGGDRAVPPHAIPPLPREALEAANAYPRGKNNPDIQYRGQKPLEQSAEDYSSEFLQEQEKHEVHYRGHKIEAPVKDGAPQFREGVNTIDTAERGRAVENKENAPSGFKAKAQKFAASLHRSFSDKE